MAVLEDKTAGPDVDYALYDADEHYYETEDALTRHLDPAFRQVVRWVDMDGRRTLLVNDRLLTVVPNPTYDPVGVPGSLEPYFRAENTEGLPMRNIIEMHRLKPEYRERDRYTGLKSSPLTEVMSVNIERPIFDMIASMICHGLFDRHPALRVATVELGAGWVPYLQRRLRIAYGKTPQLFAQDPIESF